MPRVSISTAKRIEIMRKIWWITLLGHTKNGWLSKKVPKYALKTTERISYAQAARKYKALTSQKSRHGYDQQVIHYILSTNKSFG